MPALYSPDGKRYRTEDTQEIVRLKAAGYAESRNRPPTVEDIEFHPGDHLVSEVLAYLAKHPEDADRVITEEKAGQGRVTIVGNSEDGA